MKVSILLSATSLAAAASLPARQATEHDFKHVSFEEAVAKYGSTFNSSSPRIQSADEFRQEPQCSRPLSVRREWRTMVPEEQQDWIRAVNCMMDSPSRTSNGQSLWEDLAYIHAGSLTTIHGLDRFFPWHREFVMIYERFMREDCGYQGALPWWDETLDAGNFAGSEIFSPDAFGALPQGPDTSCVPNGPFANRLFETWNGPTCLGRGVDEELSAQITQEYIDFCNTADDFHGFAQCNEGGVHNLGHEAVGGTLRASDTAPLEPLFFLHHGFIDRVWWLWQNQDPSRFSDILGCYIPVFPCPSESYHLTPETYMADFGGLSDAEVMGDVLDTRGERLCYTYDR